MQELIEASVANGAIIDPRVGEDSARFVDAFIAEHLRNRAAVREDTWPDGRWDLVKEQHTRSGAFVSVRTDITERKRAELALRDQESRLEQALAERTAQIKGILANIRSEEHTSELQSLMRISYAVYCLKKKQKIQN